jgi:hypothetical protein
VASHPADPTELEEVRSTLPTDGQYSSDGDFTNIAQREVLQLGGTDMQGMFDVVKLEANETVFGADGKSFFGNSNFFSNGATSKDPCTQNFPGDLNFRVRVPPPVKSKDAQVGQA